LAKTYTAALAGSGGRSSLNGVGSLNGTGRAGGTGNYDSNTGISTVLDTIGDDLVRNLLIATSLTRAIPNAIREVLVVAETACSGVVTAEGGGKAQHVTNANATTLRETLGESSLGGNKAGGGADDNSRSLHLCVVREVF